VPLILAGPDLPHGLVVDEPVSHVDLYPTIVEAAGLQPMDPRDLDGESLWPIVGGAPRSRSVFAEYHAAGSRNASFMVRSGSEKLVYHVGAPPQLFDLARDPDERQDLGDTAEGRRRAATLETKLRAFCDPEAVDRRAKEDQRRKAEYWGGNDAIRKEGLLVYTPPPGVAAEVEAAGRAEPP
jgi:choline-sulfatase